MKRSLSKKEIIRKKKDINEVFKKGKTIRTSFLKLIYLPSTLGYDRIIIIPVKHYGRAVDRNLVRRRAKEIFRNYCFRVSSEEPSFDNVYDYVLVVQNEKTSSFSLLKANFEELLDKTKGKCSR